MTEQVTSRTNNGILYISLSGRVDATNASAVEEDIHAVRAANPGLPTVIDADDLAYISSAGLRVIMRLRKDEPKLAIINASDEVYQVFEMTGFTDMMKIEKAYRRISVDGCEFIARGANGIVYRYDPETIVKVFFNPDALPEIEQERKNARTAFVLGMNTAIPYDIVRVGNGYGMRSELLSATSISKMMIRDPEHLEEPVRLFVDTLKHIHSIQAEPGDFPEMKNEAIGWAKFVKDYIPAEQYDKLISLVQALPNSLTLLHGDYHGGNVMVQNGETILIDMDTLATGHPILELSAMYNAYVGFGEIDPDSTIKFHGYPFEVGVRFWKLALARYLGTDDEDAIRAVEEKAMVISYARMLRRAVRRNVPDRDARVKRSQEMLAELLPRVDSLTF